MATDYSSIGSFSTGAASSLSGDLIQQLYDADTASIVDPITEDLELIVTEGEKIAEINAKVDELLASLSAYDLDSSETSAFDQVTATATGDSVVFDAADVSELTKGTTTVEINQLAQKDVYQSNIISDIEGTIPDGSLSVTVNGITSTFTTDDKTYEELVDDMNVALTGTATVSLEQVSDDEYRMIIKSDDVGTDNALEISSSPLGFMDSVNSQYNSSTVTATDSVTDGETITVNGTVFTSASSTISDMVDLINDDSNFSATINDDNEIEITMADGSEVTSVSTDIAGLTFTAEPEYTNHVLSAQNLEATVDGVDYNVSTNTITIDSNLSITASQTGTSSVSIQSDTSAVSTGLEEFVTLYNELVTMVDEELYSETPSVQDTSSLKTMMSNIKTMFFGSYGPDQTTLLNYGIAFDDDGEGILELDSTVLNKALVDDPDTIKNLFIGTSVHDDDDPSVTDERGFGTLLQDFLTDLNSYDGLFSTLESAMDTREENLTTEKEDAIEDLDTKYDAMAAQFAAYATIISTMESSFSALELIIATESSSD